MVLQSKFFAPPWRGEAIVRDVLHKALSPLKGGDIALVVAPAGYGKSTLVSQWLQAQDSEFCWLSLDGLDNDPLQFWRYIFAAVERLPGLEHLRLSSDSIQLETLETNLAQLINELIAASDSQSHIMLVLDDWHVINNRVVVDQFNFFLDHLPRNLSLIITSRTVPDFKLASRRLKQQVLEVGQSELGFSLEESIQLLNDTLELALPTDEIERLWKKTEGWISGLQLAALSLRNSETFNSTESLVNFIESFSGTDRYVGDYLIGEVLAQLDEKSLHFLVKTSCLPRFSSELCDHVLGIEESQAMINRLEQNNSFIIPLDNQRQWYRFHDLFRDLLQQEMLSRFPDAVQPIHSKAAEWFQQIEDHDFAIEHALSAKDWACAISILEKIGRARRKLGESEKLLHWIELLPVETINEKPKILLTLTEVLPDHRKLTQAPEYLDKALKLIGPLNASDDDKQEAGKTDYSPEEIADLSIDAYLQRGYLHRLAGEIESATNCNREAIAIAKRYQRPNLSKALRGLGEDLYMTGKMSEAEKVLEEAIAEGMKEKELYSVVIAVNYLVGVLVAEGELERSIALTQNMQNWFRDNGFENSSVGIWQDSPLIDVYREMNEFEKANASLQPLLQGLTTQHPTLEKIYVQLSLARLRASEGNFESANRALLDADTMQRALGSNWLFGWASIDALRAKFAIQAGDSRYPVSWVSGLEKAFIQRDDFNSEEERLIAANALFIAGNYQQAQSIAETVIEQADAHNRRKSLMLAHLVNAKIQHHKKQRAGCLQCLAAALEIAEQCGHVRALLDEGKIIIELLDLAKSQNIHKKTVDRLFAAAEQDPLLGPLVSKRFALKEPLSKRELTILELVAEGMTDKSIADTLSIALSTVKTHTGNIYGKMGVKNRMQAISKARQLGLVGEA